MTSIEFLIANALVPADFVPDLLRELALPALDILASRKARPASCRQAMASCCPAGWRGRFRQQKTHQPGARLEPRLRGGTNRPGRGRRVLLQPVHLAIGQHGLSLADPERL